MDTEPSSEEISVTTPVILPAYSDRLGRRREEEKNALIAAIGATYGGCDLNLIARHGSIGRERHRNGEDKRPARDQRCAINERECQRNGDGHVATILGEIHRSQALKGRGKLNGASMIQVSKHADIHNR